jgi:drug/metabolite transporter (DMT)-like permease
VLSVLLAFASAFSNAVNLVSQHAASTGSPAEVKGWRLALYLVRQPLWLLGGVAMAVAFAFQALALYYGKLSVVQPVLVTELVFSLMLRRVWLHRDVPAAAWAAASVTTAALGTFLVMSEPEGGHPGATGSAWVSAIVTMAGLIALCVLLASRGSALRRAGFYAAGSGMAWATLASFIKSTTDNISNHGIVGMLQHGSVYGLVVAGIVGTVLTQAALHAGPLSVSQPLMVTVDPFFSVLLGVWLFGEHFNANPARLVGAVISFAVMVVGVVFMTRTAPRLPAVRPRPAPA